MSVVLECRNLSFSYPEKTLFKDFNLQIKKGERVSILGESGCGKTSLLRVCAGLEKPSGGEVLLRGQTVVNDSVFVPVNKRNIGFVFQNFALFEKVSVEKNIFYGCKNDSHKEEAKKLIEIMKLSNHLKKYPYQLSGGEKQKVALARSLALQPDLIFLDEPFSSIDPDQTQFLMKEVINLFEKLDVTALMVTHSIEESQLFSSRTVKL